jgi:hypothetical protein
MRDEALPYVRINGAVLVPVDGLRKWIAERMGARRSADAIADEILRDLAKAPT